MTYFHEISACIIKGNLPKAKELTRAALAEGLLPQDILDLALTPAMAEVGRLFECKEYFVPEMIIAARAMYAALDVLRPILAASGEIKVKGKVVIGTVKGDLHDIGKNLVAMMLEGSGFQVIDLGIDVAPANFVEAVQQHRPHILGMSALLTTTMPIMKKTIEGLQEASLRDKVKVMVGGAPVTEAFAESIGADGYAPDASAAARKALKLMEEKDVSH